MKFLLLILVIMMLFTACAPAESPLPTEDMADNSPAEPEETEEKEDMADNSPAEPEETEEQSPMPTEDMEIQDTEEKSETMENTAEYKKISAEEAQQMMDSMDVIIVDARTREEYDAGHIENAILIPFDEVEDLAEAELPDKSATILVYCRTGGRSRMAAETLLSLGYDSVLDFGGLETDWQGEVVK